MVDLIIDNATPEMDPPSPAVSAARPPPAVGLSARLPRHGSLRAATSVVSRYRSVPGSLPAPNLPVCPSNSHLFGIRVFKDAHNLRVSGHPPAFHSLHAQLWQRVGGASMSSVRIHTHSGRTPPVWRLNSGGSGSGQWEQGPWPLTPGSSAVWSSGGDDDGGGHVGDRWLLNISVAPSKRRGRVAREIWYVAACGSTGVPLSSSA